MSEDGTQREIWEMQQDHEWQQHARKCERAGVCPHSGERFAQCKVTICDCFEYDWEARHQYGTRIKVWWELGRTSPRQWPRWVAWWLWGRRRDREWWDKMGKPVQADRRPLNRDEPF